MYIDIQNILLNSRGSNAEMQTLGGFVFQKEAGVRFFSMLFSE